MLRRNTDAGIVRGTRNDARNTHAKAERVRNYTGDPSIVNPAAGGTTLLTLVLQRQHRR